MKDQYDLFTDREDAIKIFQQYYRYENDKDGRWPLLPVLTLVGPGGYGKSSLIRHLYFGHRDVLRQPHTILDFSKDPYDLFTILGTLRNNLQRQRDEHGNTLKFPRFTILYNLLEKTEGQRDENDEEFDTLLGDYSDLMGLIGNSNFWLGLLMLIFKILSRVPFIRTFINYPIEWLYERARNKPEWLWYQDQVERFREFNLPNNSSVNTIRKRLYDMCVLGRSERDFLISQILPKAFLADLRYGMFDKEPWLRNDVAKRQQGPHRVVIFLDCFEFLVRNAEPTAKELLNVLALNEYRKRGDTDPLLLVISSEERPPDMSREQLNHHFPSVTWPVQQPVGNLSELWFMQMSPGDQLPTLKLKDMYLPLPLSPFLTSSTREYLQKLDARNETQSFVQETVIEDIQRETQGNLVYLEQVATTLQVQRRKGNTAPLGFAVQQSGVMTIDRLLELNGRSEQQESIDHLLRLYCKQIEERDLMLSAVPRVLTKELLGLIHGLPNPSSELDAEWQRYRRLPFILSDSDKKPMVFLPDVRALFLKKLQFVSQESSDPRNNDYDRTHLLLVNYFEQRGKQSTRNGDKGNKRDLLEYCYHALALGDCEPAIEQAFIWRYKPDHWQNLLEVIQEAPVQRLSRADITTMADEAMGRVRQNKDTQEAVRAVVLYSRLLSSPGIDSSYVSALWNSLGAAYQHLQDADTGLRQDMVLLCRQRAIYLRTDSDRPLSGQPDFDSTKPDPVVLPLSFRMRVWRFIRDLVRSVLANRVAQGALLVAITFAVITNLVILPLLDTQPVHGSNIAGPVALPLLPPTQSTHWIGTQEASDQEIIGLSDGSAVFDAQRPDASAKKEAALAWREGNLQAARQYLQQATQEDVNDAEALIYLQNVQILLSHKACTVFVVATDVVSDATDGVNNGRDNLQGAYLAQSEHNAAGADTPICLYIANIGGNPDYTATVVAQIVAAAGANKAIKGVIGWPGIFDSAVSLSAVQKLQIAEIPIISPDGYDDSLFEPDVFHISPSYQDQGREAAIYVENTLHKSSAAIITDPTDSYSRYLTQGFKERFEQDGNQIVAVATYNSSSTDDQQITGALKQALAARPDFIYFPGEATDGLILFNQMHLQAPNMPLIGGDALYPLIGFSQVSSAYFQSLLLTSPAYPDGSMINRYTATFDPNDTYHTRGYGYSLPDYQVMLSCDAMNTLIEAYIVAKGAQSIPQALSSFTYSSVSRSGIAFTRFNELQDQSVFMLSVAPALDKQYHVTSNRIAVTQ